MIWIGVITRAKVSFKRISDSGLIGNVLIEDGSIIVTGDGKTYVDFGETRVPILGTLDSYMSDRSQNAVENQAIKAYIDEKIKELKYNLITDGPAVKTGRKVDGKDEYVKRYHIQTIQGIAYVESGLDISKITITKIEGTVVSNSGNIFNLDTSNYNGGNNYVYFNAKFNRVAVGCDSGNYSNAYVNLFFTFNSEEDENEYNSSTS